MIRLSDQNIELLYEVTEIHFNWLSSYNPNIKFGDVLEINHDKIQNMLSVYDETNDDNIKKVLLILKSTYNSW